MPIDFLQLAATNSSDTHFDVFPNGYPNQVTNTVKHDYRNTFTNRNFFLDTLSVWNININININRYLSGVEERDG